jgi:choline dehydrogenase-like flavoprotein
MIKTKYYRNTAKANTTHSDSQENGTTIPGLPVPDEYVRTYTSVPQASLDNRTSVLYTGAVVGGGTVINGMFFARGSAADYDAWERLGNPGWGWKDLLPYFKKVGSL